MDQSKGFSFSFFLPRNEFLGSCYQNPTENLSLSTSPEESVCEFKQHHREQRLFSRFPWHTWSEVEAVFTPHRLWGVPGPVLAAPVSCSMPWHRHTCSGNTPQIRAAKNKITLCWEGFHLNSNLLSLVSLSFPVALTPPSGIGKSRLKGVIY